MVAPVHPKVSSLLLNSLTYLKYVESGNTFKMELIVLLTHAYKAQNVRKILFISIIFLCSCIFSKAYLNLNWT